MITDAGEIAEPYRVVIAGNPSHRKRSGVTLGPDGAVNPEQLRIALDRGTAVVRLRPRPSA